MTLLINETTDVDEIKSVLCHDAIYDRIGGELISADDFCPPDSAQYIAGYVGGAIIGLMIYNQDGERLNCHFQVLPGYRTKYAREFARMALEIGEAKNASIYAEIPDCFPEVIKFAEEFDFKVIEGEKTGAIINDTRHDVITLRRDHGIY